MEETRRTFIGYVPQPCSKEAGVYIYRHLDSGKVYIGSTVNGYGRFIQHTSSLARGEHANHKFQKAFDSSPFFEIEFVKAPPDCQKEDLLTTVRRIEQKLIDDADKSKLLNIAKDVFACGGGISPSPETRAKLSQAMKGRVVSDETRRRQSEALLGTTLSEERRDKISNAKTKKAVKVGDVVYKNSKEAAVSLGFNAKNSVRFRCLSKSYPDYCFVDKDEYQLGNAPSL